MSIFVSFESLLDKVEIVAGWGRRKVDGNSIYIIAQLIKVDNSQEICIFWQNK